MDQKSKNFKKPAAARKKRWGGVLAVLAGPGKFLRSAWGRFRGTSRVTKIAVIYVMVVLAAVGLFSWRAASLHLQFPYSSIDSRLERYEYLWEDEAPSAPENPQPEAEPGALAGPEPAEAVNAVSAAEVPPPEESVPADASPDAVWPVEGEILYRFGDFISDPLVPPNSRYRYARGMTFKTEPGAPVSALWGGVVLRVSEVDHPYGSAVIVSHSGGLESYYGALGELRVAPGESVQQGQVLGLVAPGDSGEPAGLYLEIRDSHIEIDPLIYLAGS